MTVCGADNRQSRMAERQEGVGYGERPPSPFGKESEKELCCGILRKKPQIFRLKRYALMHFQWY